MILTQRFDAFVQLGLFINRHFNKKQLKNELNLHEGLEKIITTANTHNNWFINKFIENAIINCGFFLEKSELQKITITLPETQSKTIAIICAGNIPLVSFHDILCVLITGNKALLKLSSNDSILMPFFLKLLTYYEPLFEDYIFFSNGKISNFDAIITTGSNNTANHLQYYFGKYPNIIRKSRTSIAILNGNESKADLKKLAEDVFLYFGMGCRNVNKLLVPKDYSFDLFFESILDYNFVINTNKYANNYEYNRAIYLLESLPFLDNNFLVLKESEELHSPIGVLYFQYYKNKTEVENYLNLNQKNIQCVVGENHIAFGNSQKPIINDFADNINTVDFLLNL